MDLPHRPNQVEFAAPGGISGDGEESMVNYPQKIGNQCGSEVKSTWSKVWLGGHDDEYKRSRVARQREARKYEVSPMLRELASAKPFEEP